MKPLFTLFMIGILSRLLFSGLCGGRDLHGRRVPGGVGGIGIGDRGASGNQTG